MPVYLLSVEAHTETVAAWQRWCAPKPKVFTFFFTKVLSAYRLFPSSTQNTAY